MKTNVQHTSLQAYFGEVLKDLGRRQAEVLEVFTRGNFTNAELALELRLPINSITPRVFELREKGLVEEDIVRQCKATGRKAKVWKLKNALPKPVWKEPVLVGQLL